MNISVGPASDSSEKMAFLNGLEIMELMNSVPVQDEPKKKHLFLIVGSVVGGVALISFLIVVLVLGLKYSKTKFVETDAFPKRYGPVFSLWFGSRLVIIVSSPLAVEECFTKNDVVFVNRPELLMGKHLGYNNTTLGLAPYGDHWSNLRRFSTLEIFSSNRLNKFLGIRRDEINLLLCKLYRVSGQDFAKVELNSMLSELPFNIIIMRMVAGKRYYGEDVVDYAEARQFRKIIKEIFEFGGASNPGDFLPILKWIDYQGFQKRVMRLSSKTELFLQGLINEHRSDVGSKNTIFDHLLSLQESEPEQYMDQIIKGLILVLLVAGTDTSAVTTEWAMSLLLNHPEVLKKS